ncbi:TPA: hypothetical protein QDC22_007523 [Burkholderia stabilis]|nr:hypothetical protein [Burkholderia stabilis]HDR9589134.1 hypothetical protein [Burkholderia stabilis]HDR9649530.1 hypothetical protein [Burkholderia stabilis]HDR9653596.1 hypothetical protein [Burkholderia stabilis]HDR9656291.1 hypothetical protein [Burkholderia stabilis]
MSIHQYTADEAVTDIDQVLEQYLKPIGISKADALDRIIHLVNRYQVVKTAAVAQAEEDDVQVMLSADPRGVHVAVWRNRHCVYSGAHALPAAELTLMAAWKAMPSKLTPDMRAAMLRAASQYTDRTGGISLDVIYEAAFTAADQGAAAMSGLIDG